MHSIADVYHKYPINTLSTFTKIAKRHGFTAEEARKYLNERVIRDKRIPPPSYMHIYSSTPNSYQMDTFINSKAHGGLNYLMLINTNTRKAYVSDERQRGITTQVSIREVR